MLLRESKNLHCDSLPWFGPNEGYEKFSPNKCCLKNFDRVDDKIIIYFKNGSQAIIRALNVAGGKEMDLVEKKLNDSSACSYEDILNIKTTAD